MHSPMIHANSGSIEFGKDEGSDPENARNSAKTSCASAFVASTDEAKLHVLLCRA